MRTLFTIQREKERERLRERERERESERERERERERKRERETERERERERELHARASRKCGRALSIPLSRKQKEQACSKHSSFAQAERAGVLEAFLIQSVSMHDYIIHGQTLTYRTSLGPSLQL